MHAFTDAVTVDTADASMWHSHVTLLSSQILILRDMRQNMDMSNLEYLERKEYLAMSRSS